PLSQLRHPAHAGPLQKPWPRRLILLLLSILVLIVDYKTSPRILFPIWFTLPVLISAWYEDLGRSLAYAILLPLCRVGMKYLWGESAAEFPLTLFLTNFAVRVSALCLVAYLAARCGQLT